MYTLPDLMTVPPTHTHTLTPHTHLGLQLLDVVVYGAQRTAATQPVATARDEEAVFCCRLVIQTHLACGGRGGGRANHTNTNLQQPAKHSMFVQTRTKDETDCCSTQHEQTV